MHCKVISLQIIKINGKKKTKKKVFFEALKRLAGSLHTYGI